MDIIRTNIDEQDKASLYKLTRSSGEMVQNLPDKTEVQVEKFCLYNEVKQGRDGKENTTLVLSFTDGKTRQKYSTISATFIREFTYICDLMNGEQFAIIIVKGTTKGGKPFVTCELSC